MVRGFFLEIFKKVPTYIISENTLCPQKTSQGVDLSCPPFFGSPWGKRLDKGLNKGGLLRPWVSRYTSVRYFRAPILIGPLLGEIRLFSAYTETKRTRLQLSLRLSLVSLYLSYQIPINIKPSLSLLIDRIWKTIISKYKGVMYDFKK